MLVPVLAHLLLMHRGAVAVVAAIELLARRRRIAVVPRAADGDGRAGVRLVAQHRRLQLGIAAGAEAGGRLAELHGTGAIGHGGAALAATALVLALAMMRLGER